MSTGLINSALYDLRDGLFHPTELARGPWDPRAQHGGAPSALMLQRLSTLPDVDGQLTRATVEFLKPLPMTPLELRLEVVRNRRQVQRTEATLVAGEVAVARAEGLHVAGEPGATDTVNSAHMHYPDEWALPPPHSLAAAGAEHRRTATGASADGTERKHPVSFAADAVEIRRSYGHFKEQGPAAAWIRLLVPVVSGDEETSPWARLAAACDFGNGLSNVVRWRTHTFVNADLTIAVGRMPLGEWIGLHSVTRAGSDGVGIAVSQVADVDGYVGVAQQTVLIRRRKQ